MIEVSSDEPVNLFLNPREDHFCRVLHPYIRQLLDIETPYIVVPTLLDQQVLNLDCAPRLL